MTAPNRCRSRSDQAAAALAHLGIAARPDPISYARPGVRVTAQQVEEFMRAVTFEFGVRFDQDVDPPELPESHRRAAGVVSHARCESAARRTAAAYRSTGALVTPVYAAQLFTGWRPIPDGAVWP